MNNNIYLNSTYYIDIAGEIVEITTIIRMKRVDDLGILVERVLGLTDIQYTFETTTKRDEVFKKIWDQLFYARVK